MRPFLCRIFGVESKKAFDENYNNINIENKKILICLKVYMIMSVNFSISVLIIKPSPLYIIFLLLHKISKK